MRRRGVVAAGAGARQRLLAGVVKRSSGSLARFTRPKRSVTDIGVSMPVPLTSPSPCALWQSPHEKSAPFDQHRQVERAARGEVADVDVAAVLARRNRVQPSRLARRHAHHAAERLVGDDDVLAEHAAGAGQRVVMQVRRAEVVGQQAEAREARRSSPSPCASARRPAPRARRRARRRGTNTGPVSGWIGSKLSVASAADFDLRRDLPGAGFQRLEDHRVAGLDLDARRQGLVPERVRLAIVESVRGHDGIPRMAGSIVRAMRAPASRWAAQACAILPR